MDSIYWIIILAILILIEIITLSITTIWFAGGALAAFIVSLYFNNLLLEVIIFSIVSLVLLFFTRPIIMKQIKLPKTEMNCEKLVGRKAQVTATVDNMSTTGRVDVDGKEWSARSLEGVIIDKGAKVIVQGVSGNKLIVTNIG